MDGLFREPSITLNENIQLAGCFPFIFKVKKTYCTAELLKPEFSRIKAVFQSNSQQYNRNSWQVIVLCLLLSILN